VEYDVDGEDEEDDEEETTTRRRGGGGTRAVPGKSKGISPRNFSRTPACST
jgi:hypothetical protein